MPDRAAAEAFIDAYRRDPVYDFTASYTLADLPEGTRIVVIAHDETPKLLAAVARARGA